MGPIQMMFFLFFSSTQRTFHLLLFRERSIPYSFMVQILISGAEGNQSLHEVPLEVSYIIKYLSNNNLPTLVDSASWKYFKSVRGIYDLGLSLYMSSSLQLWLHIRTFQGAFNSPDAWTHSRPIKSEHLPEGPGMSIFLKTPLVLHQCSSRTMAL